MAVGLVALLAGLAFKAGFVPGHFWVPDAAQGARPGAAALLTTVPKVGGLLAAYRVLDGGPERRRGLAAAGGACSPRLTMTLGNLAAYGQDDARRLLGWSTVSQAGYLLMAVAVAGRSDLALPSLALYLAAYAVTNLGAFAVCAALPGETRLEDYRGLALRSPALALSLLVLLLGLVGTPPTAVFVGKLTVFAAALDGGLGWLVVVAAVNTVASLFYYLRWIGPVFAREGAAQAAAPPCRPIAASSVPSRRPPLVLRPGRRCGARPRPVRTHGVEPVGRPGRVAADACAPARAGRTHGRTPLPRVRPATGTASPSRRGRGRRPPRRRARTASARWPRW